MTISERTAKAPISGTHDLSCVFVCPTGKQRGVYTAELVEGGVVHESLDRLCLIDHTCTFCDVAQPDEVAL